MAQRCHALAHKWGVQLRFRINSEAATECTADQRRLSRDLRRKHAWGCQLEKEGCLLKKLTGLATLRLRQSRLMKTRLARSRVADGAYGFHYNH
jgi:hypothetical protein